MLAMDRRARLRKRALPALAAHPELFRGLLAMHVGAAPPSEFRGQLPDARLENAGFVGFLTLAESVRNAVD